MSIPPPLPLGFDGLPTCCKRPLGDIMQMGLFFPFAFRIRFAVATVDPVNVPPGLGPGFLTICLVWSNAAPSILGLTYPWQMLAVYTGGFPTGAGQVFAVTTSIDTRLGLVFGFYAPPRVLPVYTSGYVVQFPVVFPLDYDCFIQGGNGQPQSPLSTRFAGQTVFALAWFQISDLSSTLEIIALSNFAPWVAGQWRFLWDTRFNSPIFLTVYGDMLVYGFWGTAPPVLGLRFPTIINNPGWVAGIYVQPAPDLG